MNLGLFVVFEDTVRECGLWNMIYRILKFQPPVWLFLGSLLVIRLFRIRDYVWGFAWQLRDLSSTARLFPPMTDEQERPNTEFQPGHWTFGAIRSEDKVLVFSCTGKIWSSTV